MHLSLIALLLITLAAPAQSDKSKPLAGYNVISVEKVTVDRKAKDAKFPDDWDTQFQENIVDQLRRKKLFDEVINTILDMEAPLPPSAKKLVLSTRIIEYKPGNRALRYTIGWGTGATKVKALFTFTDAETGREVFSTTKEGKFLGFINVIGPGRNHAVSESSGDVIDGLIRDIVKNKEVK